jgi:hypothetical protein
VRETGASIPDMIHAVEYDGKLHLLERRDPTEPDNWFYERAWFIVRAERAGVAAGVSHVELETLSKMHAARVFAGAVYSPDCMAKLERIFTRKSSERDERGR